MKIGSIEAKRGQKAFGFLKAVETRGGFDVHVPLHIVAGANDGPTLLVQAGVSGLEIEPAMILPKLVNELDPAQMSGTLILVPLLNTSGFEFEQVNAIWDGKDLNTLGRGKADGTVSEMLIHAYFEQVVSQADAMLDIRTGAKWGYFRYAGVYKTDSTDRSRDLAISLGLPQVLLGQMPDGTMAFQAAQDGKTVVSTWIGGGPGLRDFLAADQQRIRIAVLNALKHLGILPDAPAGEPSTVIDCHTVLRVSGDRGLTLMNKEKRGQAVQAGEELGYVKHPFTGDIVNRIVAPRAGVMIHGGASWPIVPEGATLAILGDEVK